MVRQERIGLHMCDAIAKVTSGDTIGVFAMQHGPGTENAFGGVAQSFGDSTPVVVLPAGYARNINQVHPNFNAALNYRHVTKLCEQVTVANATVEALRRAFTTVKNGRPGPVLVEFPSDLLREEVPDALVAEYQKTPKLKSGPDPQSVSQIAEALVAAQRPVIVAGQGVHYGKAWPQLKALAELLEAPVMTTLGGKSSFPENHPLSLGSGGIGIGEHLWHMLQNADFIFGIGCSFTRTSFGTAMPKGKKIAHATLDPYAINKDVPVDLAAVGDAGLTLDALLAEVKDRLHGKTRDRLPAVTREIRGHREEWMGQWMPRLTQNTKPLSPYRVIWELLHTVDVKNTIITHDAGSPRDQLSPFWVSEVPLSLSRLGQDDPARLWAWAGDGRQARQARQAVHQRVGRCRDRLYRHGFRDRGARADPDPVDPDEQFLDGDRAEGDAGRDREISLDRHQRPLRRFRQGTRAAMASG